MSNTNLFVITGNLVSDPEFKTVGETERGLVNFRLASNRKFSKKEETTFFDCEMWGKGAEIFNQYMSKGRPVLVRGYIRQSRWETEDGSKRSRYVFVVEDFNFLGRKEDEEASTKAQTNEESVPTMEDIPF